MELDEIKKYLKRVKFWHILASVIVIAGIYFAYQVEIAQPRVAEAQREVDAIASRTALNSCLAQAEQNYTTNWSSSCTTGYNQCMQYKDLDPNTQFDQGCLDTWYPKSGTCSLAYNISSRWDASEQQEKDNCYKQYPQN